MKTKMKLGTKLMSAFGAVALVALVIGTVGYYGAIKNDQAMHQTGSVRLPSVDAILITKASLERIRGVVESLARPDLTAAERAEEYQALGALREQYTGALKIYHALPKNAEEAALAEQLESLIAAWRVENNKALELSREFERTGIVNPQALAYQLEQFTKDHYVAVQKVLLLLRSNQNTFAGGDDATACNAGQWLPTFRSENPALNTEVQGIATSHRQFHEAIARIKSSAAAAKPEEADRHFVEQLTPAMRDVFTHFDTMRAAVATATALQQKLDAQIHGPVEERQIAAVALLDKIVVFNRDAAATTVRDANNQSALLRRFSLGAMLAGTIIAIFLGLTTTRAITRPIQRAVDQLSAGADQTTAAATQVSTASQALAVGSSEQAAAVEETSSSLEELSSMTRLNSENTAKANDLAREACAAAEKGAADMAAMNTAMAAIKSSSDEVAKIIKTIDEIAFQTNILALNAAVEAARAGEAGMGFAVVAEEVRNLAQRSAQAAKDTATKIEGAIGNTAQGVLISTKVSQTLGEIVVKAREVNELSSAVATASREQSQGLSQINSAVSSMDKVVQTNASSAEESSAAAEELNAQAMMVRESVEELMLLVSGHRQLATPPTRPPAPRPAARSAATTGVRPGASVHFRG